MTNKKLLIRGAVERVGILLGQGCERVVILWDENPPWTPEKAMADERCWHQEREHLLDGLRQAGHDRRKVGLVCIEREFETWLLHDHKLLEKVIPTGSRSVKVKRIHEPVAIDNPKAALESLFKKNKYPYIPALAGFKFGKHLDNLDRLRVCDTFRYFAKMILGNMPKGWKPYDYQPKGPRMREEQE
jgi:hypothetical protein